MPPCRLQEGPQCGLVALSLAALARGHRGEVQEVQEVQGKQVEVQEVQELAVSRGFTKQGEMFSCRDMAALAEEVLGVEEASPEVVGVERLEDSAWLAAALAAGRLLLVPYDCAANHSPCLEGGRRAHWALVAGLAWRGEGRGEELPGSAGWRRMGSTPRPGEVQGEVMLVARQSKSMVLGLWSRCWCWCRSWQG